MVDYQSGIVAVINCRYKKAREKFLAHHKAQQQEQAHLIAQQTARREEVLRTKMEAEAAR